MLQSSIVHHDTFILQLSVVEPVFPHFLRAPLEAFTVLTRASSSRRISAAPGITWSSDELPVACCRAASATSVAKSITFFCGGGGGGVGASESSSASGSRPPSGSNCLAAPSSSPPTRSAPPPASGFSAPPRSPAGRRTTLGRPQNRNSVLVMRTIDFSTVLRRGSVLVRFYAVKARGRILA